MKARRFSLTRLAACVVTAAFLAVLLDWGSTGFSTEGNAEISTLALGVVFYCCVYAVFISVLYGISVGLEGLRIGPGWLLFPVLYVAISASLNYLNLTGYQFYELGGQVLVQNHAVIMAGRNHFFANVAMTTAIAIVSDAV